MANGSKHYLVVTREDSVFFAKDKIKESGNTCHFLACRPIYTWNTLRGIGQLVKEGPGPKARISDWTEGVTIFNIVTIYEVNNEAAIEAFYSAGWFTE